MKILVIGSGGREHALCWKLSQSPRVNQIYCAPGNGGTAQLGENLDIAANDIEGLLSFALEEKIDLTIVGPEDPLVMGIVDRFEEEGLRIFGANKKAAQLEGSKDFSKQFMERHGVPTARYKSFNSYEEAVEGLKDFSYPLVIKADGLCLGKGVVICASEKEAIKTLDDILKAKIFGDEGNTVIIEEFLDGEEASLLCIVAKNRLIPMESVRDYKKVFDGDLGPNTGGIGAYSPSHLFSQELKEEIGKSILEPISQGLEKDGLEYTGILFIGFMFVEGRAKVLEFNVRFGDPETEVLMPRLKSDLVDILEDSLEGRIKEEDLVWEEGACVTVIMTSTGYPYAYEKGHLISGLEDLEQSILVFHNGTKYNNNAFFTHGGRVLSITSLASNREKARTQIYNSIRDIDFQGAYYRNDIGIK